MRIIDANSYELLELEEQKKKKLLEARKKKALQTKKGKIFFKKKNNTSARAAAKKCAARLVNNATNAEKQLYRILKGLGIEFKFQHPIFNKDKDGIIQKFYIADFYLPNSNTIIEVDGGYHFSIDQERKDAYRTNSIKDKHKGIKVLRIKNSEVINGIKTMKFLQGIVDREKTKKAVPI